MSENKPGDRLLATTAAGAEIEVVADSRPEGTHDGRWKIHDFPVVWVIVTGRDGLPHRDPWPLASVRKIDEGS